MEMTSGQQKVLSTATDSSQFGAEMNGAMFEIVSSDIYEHKIPAIVRELSCNANDSHIKAGKGDVAFHVQLPNQFNPNFVVEDFGTGLSDQEAREVFAVYFKSTKRNSNDETGAFGLGAKTPFSYTDSFNVTCRKDGVENAYVCSLNEDYEPSIALMYSVPTDKENGVKVSVPVQREDFRTFNKETSVILSAMEVKPVVTGDESFELVVPDMYEQIEEKGFSKFPKRTQSSLYSGSDYYALMGGVLYRIPYSIQSEFDRKCNLAFSNDCAVVEFPLGELRPAASRETLSLKGNMKDKIVKRFNDVAALVLKETQDDCDKASNVFEAVGAIRRRFEGNPYALSAFEFKGKNVGSIVTKRSKLPFWKDTHVCKLETSYRSTKMKCASLNTYDREDFIGITNKRNNGKVYLVSVKGGENKVALNWMTNVRRWMRMTKESDSLVIMINRNLSEGQIKRYNSLSGNRFEVVDYADIKDWMSTQHKERVTRGPNTTKEDTTVYARRFVFDGGSYQEFGDPADNYRTGELGVNYFYTFDDSEVLNINIFKTLSNKSDKKTVIFKANSNNISKLKRLGVTKDIREEENRLAEENKDLVLAARCLEMYTACDVDDLIISTGDNIIRFLDREGMDDGKKFKKAVEEYITPMKEKLRPLSHEQLIHLSKIRKVENDDKMNAIKDLREELRKKYELADRISHYRSDCVELMKVIDYAHKHGYNG